MPCPADTVEVSPAASVVDLLELHAFTGRVSFPKTKAELVAAVVAATGDGRELRALGSNWSLSHVGVATDVIDTQFLHHHLSQPYPAGTQPLAARWMRTKVANSSSFQWKMTNRLREGPQDLLERMFLRAGEAAGHFLHVEAGIKLYQLLGDLQFCGLALPTMGAGAGQSLAGALSTGTHGGDVDEAPLVEWLRAIHLVGPGGQEWWLTPTQSIFAGDELLSMPDWCTDCRIVADDDAFNAARVAVGRIGVIYSVILEVVPAYVLVEVNLSDRWHIVRGQLAGSSIGNKTRTGFFEQPLTDLDSGFGRFVVDTFGPPSPPKSEILGTPTPPTTEQEVHDSRLKLLNLTTLADDLRGSEPRPLRHANIVVNLAQPDQCWVTRRWAFGTAVQPAKMETASASGLVKKMIENPRFDDPKNPSARGKIIEALQDQFSPDALGSFLLSFDPPKNERLQAFVSATIPSIVMESTTSGEALFLTVYTLLNDPVLGEFLRERVLAEVAKAIGADFKKLVRAGLASDLLDTHNYDLDHAQSGNSAEFLFDASTDDYLLFSGAVVELATKHFPVLGYMGIRFTPRASALLAMQRFALTAAVEVATGRARQHDVYASFWDDLHAAADTHGGIPHWGQEFRYSKSDIEARYGGDLQLWRSMLAELSIEGRGVFSTPFSRGVGLEPTKAHGIFQQDALEPFLLALAAASD